MKLIKNKNEISNNINEANSDSLVLTREVAEKLDAIIGTQAPEKGGFLFGDKDTINEFIADAILAVFKEIFAENWGIRSQDVLSAALLTLAEVKGSSLLLKCYTERAVDKHPKIW